MITLSRITDINAPIVERIKNTYLSSFPIEERRDFDALLSLITNEERFELYSINDENYLGFITVWKFEDFCYIEHFAIETNKRGKGIGSTAIRRLMQDVKTPIVLEVELPTDEIKRRRISFYRGLGFNICDNTYFQPPYRPEAEMLEMRIMQSGFEDINSEYEKIKEVIYKEVYRYEPLPK
jgi:ribosomal protein S18 acetylase RimI-like enzyme